MRTPAITSTIILVIALCLCSCAAIQKGVTVVKHEPGGSPLMTAAPYDGVYALYDSGDATPKVVHALNQGEQLGFKLIEDKLVAVAGSHTHALADPGSTHYWRRLRDKTDTDQ